MMQMWVKLRARPERGATMVEGAIAATILFMLIFAIIQFAFLVFALVDARNASGAGARRGEIASNGIASDMKVLQTIRQEARLTSKDQVERVIVYWPATENGAVPSACLTANNNGVGQGVKGSACNIYSAADYLTYSAPSTSEAQQNDRLAKFHQIKRDATWPSPTRNVRRSGPPDYLGVTVVMKSKRIGGPFQFSKTFTATTVTKLQASES